MFRPGTSGVSVFSDFVANGHQALQHVSSSPSKIPYVGFSPVRLQTGIQPRPSPATDGLSARPAFPRPSQTYTWPKLPSQRKALPQRCRWFLRRRAMAQTELPSISTSSNPVQRPLARPQVMLSHRVIAYYGLIRNSRPLPSIYELYDGSLPYGLVWAGIERLPNLLLVSLPSVPPSVPRWTERLHVAVPSSLALAFAFSAQAQHPQAHARRFSRGQRNEATKFALCYGPEELLALHRQGPLLPSFRSPGSPQRNVGYHYAGKQPIPATGLAPARHAALWAASRGAECVESIASFCPSGDDDGQKNRSSLGNRLAFAHREPGGSFRLSPSPDKRNQQSLRVLRVSAVN